MEAPEQYNLIITGKVLDGFSITEAKNYIQKVFKLNKEKADSLLCGRETTIKSGITYDAANKIKHVFEQGGIECRIEEIKPSKIEPIIESTTQNKPENKTIEYVPANNQNENIIQTFILGLFAIIVRLAWSLTIGLVLFSIGTVLFLFFDILFPESSFSYKILTNTYKWGSCHWFKRLKLETDEYSVEVEKRR